MILPTKYIPASDSILGKAGLLLSLRKRGSTVSSMWYEYRSERPGDSFDSFSEALTLLFLIGSVNFDEGLLKWEVKDED